MRRAVCAAALLAFVGLSRRERRMPLADAWRRALVPRHGETRAAFVVGRAEALYRELHAARPRFAHPMLGWHVTQQILPFVALYRTLRETEDETSALADVDACAEALSKASMYGPLVDLADRMPGAFGLMRLALRWMTPVLFPAPHWVIAVRRDDPEEYAFDIFRCPYVELFAAYGMPEVAERVCRLDDLRYGALRAATFERTGTLAGGAERCDFRFARTVQA